MPMFRAKPEEFEARLVHQTTLFDIAAWCDGDVMYTPSGVPYAVRVPGGDYAYEGDYVIDNGFYPDGIDRYDWSAEAEGDFLDLYEEVLP